MTEPVVRVWNKKNTHNSSVITFEIDLSSFDRRADGCIRNKNQRLEEREEGKNKFEIIIIRWLESIGEDKVDMKRKNKQMLNFYLNNFLLFLSCQINQLSRIT